MRIIDPEMAGEGAAGRPLGAIVTGLVVVVGVLVSVVISGVRLREQPDARDRTREILELSLKVGNRDPLVQGQLKSLRRDVGKKPLDAMTRVMYAGTLLGLGRSTDDTRAAAFHAATAASIAPVTVPVVRRAALVLGRCGETDKAAVLVRKMFMYDPSAAADLLAVLEYQGGRSGLEGALPDDADAWLAWSRKLRELGRTESADLRLERAVERWPEHIPVIQAMAAMALGRRDWAKLSMLFPDDRAIPNETRSALLFAFRARLHARQGDREAAVHDVETAMDLSDSSVAVLIHAGDAMLDLGDIDIARNYWRRALYRCLPGNGEGDRLALLIRLARLEDKHGQPATALRLWRELLALDPGNGEAQRRIDAITNFHR